ncbi:MAG: hypothetical protein KDF65_14160, partial [Anaerolineae bacterium]|nr:hypothetical protein [Anaerolineae bacterium]
IGLSLWLMQLFASLGWPSHAGLALANSIAVMLEMAALLVLLRPKMAGLANPGLGPALLKMGLATLGMALVLGGVLVVAPAGNAWLTGLTGIGLGGGVYLGLALALGLDEIKVLRRLLRR